MKPETTLCKCKLFIIIPNTNSFFSPEATQSHLLPPQQWPRCCQRLSALQGLLHREEKKQRNKEMIVFQKCVNSSPPAAPPPQVTPEEEGPLRFHLQCFLSLPSAWLEGVQETLGALVAGTHGAAFAWGVTLSSQDGRASPSPKWEPKELVCDCFATPPWARLIHALGLGFYTNTVMNPWFYKEDFPA